MKSVFKLSFFTPLVFAAGCVTPPEIPEGTTAEELARMAECPQETAEQRQAALREIERQGELFSRAQKPPCQNQQANSDENADPLAARREALREAQRSIRSATESLGTGGGTGSGIRLPSAGGVPRP